MEGGPATSEYLCTLQPPADSALARELLKRRAGCFRELGADGTGLYPPHVSVTGFFTATPQQAAGMCAAVEELVAGRGGLHVDFRRVLSTDDGHVLIDVVAPALAGLSSALAARAELLGMQVRPKAVRHLSLASGRRSEEQARIAALYGGVPLGPCAVDIVVSRLLRRSDAERLRRESQAHVFCEVLRLRLPGAGQTQRARTPLSELVVGNVATPVKKRHLDQGSVGQEGNREVTPPKVAKPDACLAQAQPFARVGGPCAPASA